jgi:hypothetical protein
VTESNVETPIKHPVTTGLLGDYFRPLINGSYQIAIEAEGYEPAMRVVNITNVPHKEAQRVDFLLHPQFIEGPGMPLEESQPQYEPADYQLTPEQAEQLIQLIEYSREKNKLQPLSI